MPHYSKKKKKGSCRKWLPFLAAGLFGIHFLAYLTLSQCRSEGPGVLHRPVTYIKVEENHQQGITLQLREPPQKMFYQYTSAPLVAEDRVVQLTAPPWDGYRTLVILREDNSTPIENYRLTMELRREERRLPRPIPHLPLFRTVLIAGAPVLPMAPVPEPSSSLLIAVSSLVGLLLSRRRRT